MYDIKQLESEWKKYRKKRQKPWYIGGLFFSLMTIFLIVFSGDFMTDFSQIKTDVKNIKSDDTEVPQEVNNNVVLNNAFTVLEIEKVEIEVDEDDKKRELVSKSPENNKVVTSNIVVDVPILDDTSQRPMNTVDSTKQKKKVQIDIFETSSVTAYEDVENRFFVSRDVDDALFLAKSYYKKGLYEKAEFWALETNKLDGNIEESLLIFAKSKAKLGHKNEAITILSNYLSKTASQDAKDILSRIENDSL